MIAWYFRRSFFTEPSAQYPARLEHVILCASSTGEILASTERGFVCGADAHLVKMAGPLSVDSRLITTNSSRASWEYLKDVLDSARGTRISIGCLFINWTQWAGLRRSGIDVTLDALF